MHSKLLLLSLIFISNFALGMEQQEVPTNKKSSFQKYVNQGLGYLQAELYRGKGFTPFSRGEGYWSSPKDETNTGFFNRLAEPESQREDWYSVTPYISEFWCAISNIGLLLVGLKYQSPEVVCAGLASFAYHSCPKQWLLYVDRIGVAFAFLKLAREYQVLKENPHLLCLPVAAGAINLLDVYLGRYKGKTWSHVVWHLSAAAMAAYYLSHVKE